MNHQLKWAVLATLCASVLGAPAFAADVKTPATKASVVAEGKAGAGGEAQVRKAVATLLGDPSAITAIRKLPYGNFYEVLASNGDLLYVDATGSYLFAGQLIDVKARKNITSARQNELAQINFADLPLAQAIKQVRGNGKRVIATFEDPNCGYCRKLAKDMQDLKDTTIYIFMVPILSADSEVKGKSIWCSADRGKAWNDWMVDGKEPAQGSCDTPLAKNSEIAQKYRINGTPTIFTADGKRIGGYVALSELEAAITAAEKAKTAKN